MPVRTVFGVMTLAEVVATPGLGLSLVAGGDLGDRPVRWAHATELLDPRRYLTGGELVLTVGTVLGEPEACRRFVDHLLEAGVSALGYGVGDVTAEIPAALVEECRGRGLPLVRVPDGVPFQNITTLLADRRAEARSSAAHRVQRLTANLLDAITHDVPLPELLTLLESDLGGPLRYDDGGLDWLGPPGEQAPGRDTLRHLARVLAVAEHGQDREEAARRRESGRLLELVVQGRADVEVLRTDLARAGIEPGATLVVSAWPHRLVGLVMNRLERTAFMELRDVLVAIGDDREQTLRVAGELAVPVGIGDPVPEPDVGRGVPPALSALRLARSRGAPVAAGDMSSFEVLLELQPPARLAAFQQDLVAPLAAYDARHGSELVPTLRAYLAADGATGRAAQALFAHPNTIRYRLHQIHRLTGRDPQVFTDRVSLAIGLWSHDRTAPPA